MSNFDEDDTWTIADEIDLTTMEGYMLADGKDPDEARRRYEQAQKRSIQNVTLDQILSAYSGKPGCMCGCNGKYYHTKENQKQAGEDRGYPVEDEDVSPKMVTKILKILQKEKAEIVPRDPLQGFYAAADVGKRVYAIYLKS